MVQETVAPVGWPGDPCNVGLLTVSCSVHWPCADVAAAQAGVEPPGANPPAISAAIEANERNKMVLRSIIILLFVSLNTGATESPYSESNGPVSLRIGWIRLSSVITEEGLGIIYLFDYYWRRERKHVAVIFYYPCCN